MPNNREDFAPEVRNQAWWATDTRRAVNGKATEVILEKQGKKPLDDLSGIEAVQMGHVMQPVIGRLVTDRLGIEIKDADYALAHDTELWLRSHFDFITTDGHTLVEAKNYNAMARNKFDPETNRVPNADYFQCLHEATVHNVDNVILAVLFGGQEFQTFSFTFTQDQKLEFIQNMAVYWGFVNAGTVPEPDNLEATKLVYPVSVEGVIMANKNMEDAIYQLKNAKTQIKQLEEYAEGIEVQIRNFMGDRSEIQSVDGSTLVTWKSAKSSKRFNADLFKSSMPDLYEKYVVDTMGSRRFLIK